MARARTLSVVLAGTGLIAAATPASAAAPASAGEDVTEVKTRVTIEFKVATGGREKFVKGRVRSPEDECEGRRLVKIIGERAGNLHGREDGDVTRHRGRFTLSWLDNARAHYRVKVFSSFRHDGSLKCKADAERFRFR
jgi:hypothetical protein